MDHFNEDDRWVFHGRVFIVSVFEFVIDWQTKLVKHGECGYRCNSLLKGFHRLRISAAKQEKELQEAERAFQY